MSQIFINRSTPDSPSHCRHAQQGRYTAINPRQKEFLRGTRYFSTPRNVRTDSTLRRYNETHKVFAPGMGSLATVGQRHEGVEGSGIGCWTLARGALSAEIEIGFDSPEARTPCSL